MHDKILTFTLKWGLIGTCKTNFFLKTANKGERKRQI